MSRRTNHLLATLLLLTVACSPSGNAARTESPSASKIASSLPSSAPTAVSPTQVAVATASASDLVAVAKVIYPYSAQFNYYTVCGANGDLSQCPVTDRLKAYLQQKQITLCGCQNPAPSMDATATSSGAGGVAHVILGYQPTPLRYDLIIVRDGGRLLVDDQQCTGAGASSSIYVRTGGC